ncbi:MAG TPA: hypothetical protein VNR38_03670 [Ureibacillus sp.]|nr:hypothetical protein [Ureibacillus sp.]
MIWTQIVSIKKRENDNFTKGNDTVTKEIDKDTKWSDKYKEIP